MVGEVRNRKFLFLQTSRSCFYYTFTKGVTVSNVKILSTCFSDKRIIKTLIFLKKPSNYDFYTRLLRRHQEYPTPVDFSSNNYFDSDTLDWNNHVEIPLRQNHQL